MGKLEAFRIVISFIPIIWLLISIAKYRVPTHYASLVALIVSVISALFVFRMSPAYVFQASLEGFMMALHPILFVIISALFVYNITIETGSMEQIKNMLSSISPDRRIQALILAFGFGGFLEAVAGFGTAVAIPAGILIAMGFNPLNAATVCLIANTIPVAFGVLGVPITTLSQVTALPLNTISIFTALQLVPFVVLLPLVLVYTVTGRIRNIRGVTGVSVASGIAFAAGQTLATIYIGPELAAVIGSLSTLAVIILWVKLSPIKQVWDFDEKEKKVTTQFKSISLAQAFKAWSIYLLIVLLIFITRFIPSLDFLYEYPFVIKKQFYFGAEGRPLTFELATGAGTVLLLSAVIGGIIQGATFRTILSVLWQTIVKAKNTIFTVILIVMVAKIMGYSGMVNSIAAMFAAASGKFYPFLAPFIGALGTFITGSDTSSNVLFGNLQKQTALELGMSQEWLAAANASGATAGKMISPQSISIAAASTGLEGKESDMLKTTIKYCIIYVLLMGILVFLFALNRSI